MSIRRISLDEYYLNIAKAVSVRSSCICRQYGAVIVNNREIIATGYNGSPRGETNCCDLGYCKRYDPKDSVAQHNDGNYDLCNSVHAEQNAMLSAARKDMIGATLYLYGQENNMPISVELCPICQRMANNAGIDRIVVSKE